MVSQKPFLFLDVTQCRLILGYRRFGTVYHYVYKGQVVQEIFFLDCLTLENGLVGLTETLVTN